VITSSGGSGSFMTTLSVTRGNERDNPLVLFCERWNTPLVAGVSGGALA
jgi:hypothetical protein